MSPQLVYHISCHPESVTPTEIAAAFGLPVEEARALCQTLQKFNHHKLFSADVLAKLKNAPFLQAWVTPK